MSTEIQKKSVKTEVIPASHYENILVVKREYLVKAGLTEGFTQGVVQKNMEKFRKVIAQRGEFLPRYKMEKDESYKQIIPYLVFTADDKLFLMQRSAKASEQRLASRYSLGIGGHVNQSDLVGHSIEEWGMREFHEEVNYSGKLSIQPLGILNVEDTPVDRVHMGLVFLFRGDTDQISIKSELQFGKLATYKECDELYDRMETWSKLVFDMLKSVPYV